MGTLNCHTRELSNMKFLINKRNCYLVKFEIYHKILCWTSFGQMLYLIKNQMSILRINLDKFSIHPLEKSLFPMNLRMQGYSETLLNVTLV